MNSDQRSFHISDVLSVTSERLVSTRGMEGVYDILGWMTDSQPFTHQLPRINDEVKPFLVEQHPELSKLVIPDAPEGEHHTRESVDAWLETLYPTFGTEVVVTRIPAEAHTEIDPISELRMKGIEFIQVQMGRPNEG